MSIQVVNIYISDEHNFFGHHGKPAGKTPMREVPEIQCVARRGIVGDRFFDYKESYKGQITFFAEEIYHDLCKQLQVDDKPPSAFRRNVITRGVNLNDLIGKDFTIQGVQFQGIEECSPCYWMDEAFGPGAEKALKDNGGLRAHILTDGTLKTDV